MGDSSPHEEKDPRGFWAAHGLSLMVVWFVLSIWLGSKFIGGMGGPILGIAIGGIPFLFLLPVAMYVDRYRGDD